MLSRTKGRRRSRGGVLIEFALTVPFAVFLMLLTLDVGKLALASAELSDAAAVSARAVARQGYIGSTRQVGPVVSNACNPKPTSARDVAWYAFCAAVGDTSMASVTSFTVSSPPASTRTCTTTFFDVVVRATAQVSMTTPGLSAIFGGSGSPLGGDISAVGVARCEVARAS